MLFDTKGFTREFQDSFSEFFVLCLEKDKMRFFLGSLLLILLLTGCQAKQATEPLEEKRPGPMATIDISKISADVTVYPIETLPTPATSVIAPPEITKVFDSFTEGFIMKAKNDLNQQIGINTEKINVLSVEAVEWPDGSIGCGKPGTEYLQVVTPGFLIVLEANSQIYTYHTDMSSQIILCSEKPPIRFSPTP